jgi:hypothetical protein
MDNIVTFPFTLPSTAVPCQLPSAVMRAEQEGKLVQKIVEQKQSMNLWKHSKHKGMT